MKKSLLIVIASVLGASHLSAGVILSDTFSYPDGGIVGAPGSPWVAHSGSGGVMVATNQLRVSSSLSEDINAPLTGAPYDTTNNPTVTSLYSSFTVNFSTLPGSAGTYFAHFKDDTTFGFRGRLFALSAGTNVGGTFRLGIASTNSLSTTVGFAPLETDLELGTTYTVVTRLNLADGTATLWINPSSESDASVSSTANPGTAIPMHGYAFRQSGGSGITLVDDLKIGTSFADVAGANTAPTISVIANQNTPANTASSPIAFTVGDAETAAESLTVSGTSSNTGLVPNGNISFGGSGANRTVTLTPAPGQQGSTTITVSVSDGVNSSSAQFILSVGAPTISTIGNQAVAVNQATGPISFTIGDAETPGALTLSGSSTNTSLLPDENIVFGGSGANRTVTLTPAADQTGVSSVTITVSDGNNSSSTTFLLSVSPVIGLVMADDFSYPDGSLYVNPSGTSPWQHHSPTSTNFFEVQVIGGKALISQTNAEDVNAVLTNSPFGPTSGVTLYAGFTVNFSALPSVAGEYFAHFKDSGSTFRAKVFASRTDAATNMFRLSIANAANSATFGQVAQDLSLDTTYTVVIRYDCATGESELWVNPTSEASPSVTATDPPLTMVTTSFALRESSGMGTLFVDDLKVAGSFAEVFTAPTIQPSLSIVRTGNPFEVEISWPADATGYVLETKSDLNTAEWSAGPTANLSGDRMVVITSATGNQFYRLIKN